MTKIEFLAALEQRLKGRLPDADIFNTLDFYSESIADHMEDGMSEEEAVAAIGTPEAVAAQILSDLPEKNSAGPRSEQQKPSTANGVQTTLWNGLAQVFSILLAIVGFSLLLAYYSMTFGLLAGAVGCAIGGTICLFLVSGSVAMIVYGSGLICLSLGLVLCPGLKTVTCWLWKVVTAPFHIQKAEKEDEA